MGLDEEGGEDDFGFWVLDFGFWIKGWIPDRVRNDKGDAQDIRSWELEEGFRSQESEFGSESVSARELI